MLTVNRLMNFNSTINVPLTLTILCCFFYLNFNAQNITSFTLIDAQSDVEIGPISDGQVFVLNSLPTDMLNVRANTQGTIASVYFELNGVKNQTENVVPYALFGDINGNYKPWTPDFETYTVTATAYSGKNANGNVLDVASITFSFEMDAPSETPPEAPSNLTGTSETPNTIELAWNDNADNEESFTIQYKPSNYTNDQWVDLVTLPANATMYTHSGLANNEFNYYRIKAENSEGSSMYSPEIEVANFPFPPSGFVISGVTQNSFDLAWTEAPYGNSYFVETASSPAGPWSSFDALYYGYTEFTYSGFDPGVTYYFRMRTGFQNYLSDWSEVFSVTTLPDDTEPQGPNITGFVLVNADTDLDIQEIMEGDSFNLYTIGTDQLNVRAEVDGGEESVVFGYNGNPNFRTENFAVYALAGNNGSNYLPWIPDLGLNTVTATAYTGNGGSGSAGPSSTINFYVVDENTDPDPDPDPDPDTTGVDLGVSGDLMKWHKVTVTFEGPELNEASGENPFKDYRLDVTFTNGSTTYVVPGYYAADGSAENTGASSGKIWKVHFSPDQIGQWTYAASFRKGDNVALSDNPNSGNPVSFDGASDIFTIAESDKTGRDFRGRGRLVYVGEHYLRFADSGDYFIKAGADAPENTFAYDDFDATPNSGGRRKSWQPHAADFDLADAGAYTWGSLASDGARTKGRNLLGALNYLANEGMNAFSFLTFSLDGDDDNVYPHVQLTSNANSWNNVDHLRFDVSKMAQWEKVMEYADKKGIFLHFKMQETENDQRMDGGQLGDERKLYYRELIARYGHHLALNWNLGEENDIWQELNNPSGSIIKSYADYIRSVDPYDHHIVIHTYPGQQDEVYDPLIGNASELTGPSVQTGINNVHRDVVKWVEESRNAGKKWVVANDEQGGANAGVTVDAAYPTSQLPEPRNEADNRTAVRSNVLWGTLMGGGSGVEYYYGYQTGCDDLDCEDHRTRQTKWDDARHALAFFNDNLQPYLDQMESDDGLSSSNSDYVLAKANEVYVLYLPSGGSTNINLGNTGLQYTIEWYNPRSGGALQSGSKAIVNASNTANIGNPPSQTSQDWVVLLKKIGNAAIQGETVSPRNIDTEFKLYPNPSSQTIFIEIPNLKKNRAFEVTLYDVTGRRMVNSKINSSRTQMEVAHFPPGNYTLVLTGKDYIQRKSLVIIK